MTPKDFNDLTLFQLMEIVTPYEPPIVRAKADLGPQMLAHQINNKVEKMRYELFDRVCDAFKVTPTQLAVTDIHKAVGMFVEVSGLPPEKFQPPLLRQRLQEYVLHKSNGKV